MNLFEDNVNLSLVNIKTPFNRGSVFTVLTDLQNSLIGFFEPESLNQSVSYQLIEKYHTLDKSAAVSQDIFQSQKLRMHQLAVAKILVGSHQRPVIYLTISHTKLAQTYILTQCWQQAKAHLKLGININSKQFNKSRDLNIYHLHMMNLVAYTLDGMSESSKCLDLIKKNGQLQKILNLKDEVDYQSFISCQRLKMEASCLIKSDQNQAAAQIYTSILTKLSRSNQPLFRMEIIQRSISLEKQQRNHQRALRLSQTLIQIAEKQNLENLIPTILTNISRINFSKADYQNATKVLTKVIQMTSEHQSRSSSLIELVKMEIARQNFTQAYNLLKQQISLQQNSQVCTMGLGWMYMKLGEMLKSQGRQTQSNIYLKKALKFYQFFQQRRMINRVKSSLSVKKIQ